METKEPIVIEYFNYAMSNYAKLTLPPGKLCIIKGENNNGKSCLFYGLEWLLLNDPLAKTLINNQSLKENPKAELRVRITQGDYFIEIKRSMANISYNINGKIYDKKLNKQSIFDLEPGVRIPGFVYVKDCVYTLFNMHGEDRGLFPITENNDQGIYVLFEKLLGLINSKKIITATQKEISEAKAQYDLYEAECQKANIRAEKLKQISSTINLQKIKDIVANSEKLENALSIYKQNKQTLGSLVNHMTAIIPAQIDSSNLNQSIVKLSTYLNAKASLEKTIQQISILQNKSVNQISVDKLQLCTQIMQKLIEAKGQYDVLNNESWKISLEKRTIEDTRDALQKQWDAIEVCPMCGAPKSTHSCISMV